MAGPMAERVSSAVQAIGAGLVIVTTVGGIILYASGGLKPQTQASVEMLAGKMSDLTNSVDGLQKKLDQMPRIADFAAHTAQIDGLNRRLDEMGTRITRDEIEASANRAVVDSILHPSLPAVRATR